MMRMLRLPGTALLAVLLLTAPVRSDAPSEKRIPLRLRGRNNTQRLQNREQYLGYLRSMLKPAEPATAPASGEKTVAADVARDAYVNARRLCPTDPRLETAVGIALIRAGERTEAMQRISMAMKSRTTLYPPATELYLYHQVAAGKHGDVPSAATAYARRLGLQPDQYPGEEERERAAGWLGRMMGYLLKGPATIRDGRTFQSLARADQEISRILPPDLADSYAAGRRDVATEFSRHRLAGKEDADTAGAEQPDAAARAQEILEQEKTELVDQTRDDMTTLQEKIAKVGRSIALLDARARQLQDRGGQLNLLIESGEGTPAMEREVRFLQAELRQASLRRTELTRQTQQLNAKLQVTMAAYKKATGRAIDLEANLAEYNNRLKAQGAIAAEAMLLETYIACDLDQYATDLLASYR